MGTQSPLIEDAGACRSDYGLFPAEIARTPGRRAACAALSSAGGTARRMGVGHDRRNFRGDGLGDFKSELGDDDERHLRSCHRLLREKLTGGAIGVMQRAVLVPRLIGLLIGILRVAMSGMSGVRIVRVAVSVGVRATGLARFFAVGCPRTRDFSATLAAMIVEHPRDRRRQQIADEGDRGDPPAGPA